MHLPFYQAWYLSHVRSFLSSLNRFSNHPVMALLTIGLMGVAWSLPLMMMLLLQNVHHVASHWDRSIMVTTYWSPKVSNRQLIHRATEIAQWSSVIRTRVITPQQGLKDFSRYTGQKEIMKSLGINPLPGVIVVYPSHHDPGLISDLQKKLGKLIGVVKIRSNLEQFQRLLAIINILSRLTNIFSIVLIMGVVLVIIHTVRLDVVDRRDEIEVTKMIGATNAYICRPFWYSGLFTGLLAGLLSVAILVAGSFWIAPEIHSLMNLYGIHMFVLIYNWKIIGEFVLGLTLLSALSSWGAATYYLLKIYH